jgi:hypothetical protein
MNLVVVHMGGATETELTHTIESLSLADQSRDQLYLFLVPPRYMTGPHAWLTMSQRFGVVVPTALTGLPLAQLRTINDCVVRLEPEIVHFVIAGTHVARDYFRVMYSMLCGVERLLAVEPSVVPGTVVELEEDPRPDHYRLCGELSGQTFSIGQDEFVDLFRHLTVNDYEYDVAPGLVVEAYCRDRNLEIAQPVIARAASLPIAACPYTPRASEWRPVARSVPSIDSSAAGA